ncbi:glycoside hydrolase family 2 TIM barrel-domain containing protein [Catellatospora tritici]|uniref:glycoside hydrolase family 2 TIM barrel-domain containing protein n=1 Tax=Catellatospora tritici TaxID=2851566 RepID=UPI001C2D1525|nr:glycoside hydrolase family 2 TIM barrel-domain containing protein [Catellatospora tritici]MBV1853853.1 discoidin domain-containing protein [Catellatospora tritici]
MSRRRVAALLALLTPVATIALVGTPSTAMAAPYVPQPSNRQVLNFDTNWLFAGDVPAGNGQAVGLSESAFVPVTLPYFRTHPHKGFPKGDFEVPASWYRRHFTVPSAYSGRRLLVEFQGVAKAAQVYVNGTLAGQHNGAYTSFTVDITPYVTVGGADNVVAVKVDSMTRNDLPPEGGAVDYFVWGGIVRDVNMIVADPVHTDWAFVTTPSVSASSATVNARTNVRNDSGASKSVTVVTSVVDTGGNVVATGTATQTIAANSAVEFNYNTSAIANPHRWDVDDPYLYTVYTQVRDGSTWVDEHRVRIGVRTVAFNATDGKFYLNGTALKLRGLDRHESYPYIGRAAPNRLQAKDADILKYELGTNLVRTSHYPQDPEFLDRADEIGLLVFEEIPGWQHIGDTAWQDIAVENVREMVTRDRNHPSIIMWGVRINESGDNHNFYTRTNALAHQLDPSRPTGGVRNFTGSEKLEDVYTFNDFSGGAIAPTVLPWLVTESVGHTDPDRSFDPEQVLTHTMLTHLNVQNQAASRANVAGALGWAAFDYNTTFDTESCIDYTCYHGVSDIFRIAKPAAAVFTSQRDPAKYGAFVQIAHDWAQGSSTTVYVAGNCQQVELFANGVSKGRISPNAYTSLPHPFFQFNNVTWAAGSLRADCWIGGSIAASDTQYTPGTPVKLSLAADDASLKADGADMTRVVVKALDANNQVVPTGNAAVSFGVTGPGAVVGSSPLVLEGGVGAVYVKTALGQTGTIAVTATSPGLTSAGASVTAAAFTDPIVPVSGSYTFGFPVDVNDRVTGTGANQFNYTGTGWANGGDGNAFGKDNSWSGTANDAATLAFTGTRVVLYGILDTTHGQAAVSVDGGTEQTVSFTGTRRANTALWSSATLAQGNHTLRVRVVGNGPVALDRATVVAAAPTVVSAPVAASGDLIPQSRYSVRYVDSQDFTGDGQTLSGPAISAFDGSTKTFWHTRWSTGVDPLPHELQLDLGTSYPVAAFTYLPRQDAQNGRIGQYEFYVSADGSNWGSPVATGTFPNSTAAQNVSFAAKSGRYVRLRALSSADGQYASVADLKIRTAGASTTTVDDRVTGTGQNQFNYTGTWQSCTNCGADLYAGTNSWSNTANNQVTVAFTGTQIRLYGVRDPRHGIAMVSIDGGTETAVDFYATARLGNTLVWTSPVLSAGAHTLRVRVTATKNSAATDTFVVPDRVDITG